MNRHNWLQFSLRGFLTVITIFAVWLGWNVDRAAKQHAAIEAVDKLGGGTSYVWETRPEDGYPGNWSRPVPACLCEMLSDDHFADVGIVWFGPEAVDADLRWIANFDASAIRFLSLNSLQLSDLALNALPYMPNLKTLHICGGGITDDGLKNLAKCPNVINLHLQYAPQVTDAGARRIKQLTHLTRLCIEHSRITESDVAELRKALPQCQVLD